MKRWIPILFTLVVLFVSTVSYVAYNRNKTVEDTTKVNHVESRNLPDKTIQEKMGDLDNKFRQDSAEIYCLPTDTPWEGILEVYTDVLDEKVDQPVHQ